MTCQNTEWACQQHVPTIGSSRVSHARLAAGSHRPYSPKQRLRQVSHLAPPSFLSLTRSSAVMQHRLKHRVHARTSPAKCSARPLMVLLLLVPWRLGTQKRNMKLPHKALGAQRALLGSAHREEGPQGLPETEALPATPSARHALPHV